MFFLNFWLVLEVKFGILKECSFVFRIHFSICFRTYGIHPNILIETSKSQRSTEGVVARVREASVVLVYWKGHFFSLFKLPLFELQERGYCHIWHECFSQMARASAQIVSSVIRLDTVMMARVLIVIIFEKVPKRWYARLCRTECMTGTG